MTSVINLRAYANPVSVPIVVFVDLQQEYQASPRLLAIPDINRALLNCRRVLEHARHIGLPVAFARRVNSSGFFNPATPFARWIEGFEPSRHEMIFERSKPSCYSSELFANFANHSDLRLVMCGFAGESACLATMIDAHHRNHTVTYLADASASHDLDDLSARETHRAVSKICRLYGEVSGTEDWISATLPRYVNA